MAEENLQPVQVANAVVPVEADTTEFDTAMDRIEQRLADIETRAGKILDPLLAKLDDVDRKMRNLEFPGAQDLPDAALTVSQPRSAVPISGSVVGDSAVLLSVLQSIDNTTQNILAAINNLTIEQT